MTPNPGPLLRTVDDMLLDAGETDYTLRATLLSLGSFAAVPVPEPRAELAALLSGGTTQLGRHRLRRRHRSAAVGLAVIAGMGLGVTGVAATGSAPHLSASPSIQHLLQDWSPVWSITGKPAAQGAAGQRAGDPAVEISLGDAARGTGAAQGAAERGAAGGPAADGGASRNAAGATPGGAAPQDGPAKVKQATGSSGEAGRAEADPRRELANTGKPVGEAPAVVEDLTAGLLAPAGDDKTGAGKANPGSIWLKKFSR